MTTTYTYDDGLYREWDQRDTAGYLSTFCQARLTCGHWSRPMSPQSSTFDFPDDAIDCRACGSVDRQLDLALQLRLMETTA
jgi:hypothetical protein